METKYVFLFRRINAINPFCADTDAASKSATAAAASAASTATEGKRKEKVSHGTATGKTIWSS